jgi:hypothetical protein
MELLVISVKISFSIGCSMKHFCVTNINKRTAFKYVVPGSSSFREHVRKEGVSKQCWSVCNLLQWLAVQLLPMFVHNCTTNMSLWYIMCFHSFVFTLFLSDAFRTSMESHFPCLCYWNLKRVDRRVKDTDVDCCIQSQIRHAIDWSNFSNWYSADE